MQVVGKIKQIFDTQSGKSKKGVEWKKVDFLVETEEQYNNLYLFNIFGADKVDNFIKYNKVGSTVEVDFNVQTQEYNGKYYTSLQAWKVFSKKESDVNSDVDDIEVSVDDLLK